MGEACLFHDWLVGRASMTADKRDCFTSTSCLPVHLHARSQRSQAGRLTRIYTTTTTTQLDALKPTRKHIFYRLRMQPSLLQLRVENRDARRLAIVKMAAGHVLLRDRTPDRRRGWAAPAGLPAQAQFAEVQIHEGPADGPPATQQEPSHERHAPVQRDAHDPLGARGAVVVRVRLLSSSPVLENHRRGARP